MSAQQELRKVAHLQEKDLEAATGVEPVMEVLQTSALPLGYAAPMWASLTTSKGRRQSTSASVLCLTP